jgi:hypothetical protein
MRKRVTRKLSLNRETIHRLTDSALGRVGGAFEDVVIGVGKDTALSITACTQVISDCLGCTTPLASCPRTMFSDCTCA